MTRRCGQRLKCGGKRRHESHCGMRRKPGSTTLATIDPGKPRNTLLLLVPKDLADMVDHAGAVHGAVHDRIDRLDGFVGEQPLDTVDLETDLRTE